MSGKACRAGAPVMAVVHAHRAEDFQVVTAAELDHHLQRIGALRVQLGNDVAHLREIPPLRAVLAVVAGVAPVHRFHLTHLGAVQAGGAIERAVEDRVHLRAHERSGAEAEQALGRGRQVLGKRDGIIPVVIEDQPPLPVRRLTPALAECLAGWVCGDRHLLRPSVSPRNRRGSGNFGRGSLRLRGKAQEHSGEKRESGFHCLVSLCSVFCVAAAGLATIT